MQVSSEAASALVLALLLAAIPGGVARAAPAYEEIIQPILRARCAECHGERKQKAGLALHTWEALMRGSDAGQVIAVRQPRESILMQRMLLPLAHEEHMPPEESAQPGAAEIGLIQAWIAAGATASVSLAELDLPADLRRAAAELPAKLAAEEKTRTPAGPLWVLNAEEVAGIRAPLAAKVIELQRRFPGALSYESRTSAALHFTAAGIGRTFGDAELAELKAIAPAIVVLDVAGTAITDASASLWTRFTRLRNLRAGFTALGDASAAALGRLPDLEVLTLNHSRVSGEGVSAFKQMAKLRILRLGGTEAEQPAQAAQLPVVPGAAGFPSSEAMPPAAEPGKVNP